MNHSDLKKKNLPENSEAFYAELISRNKHFVPKETQIKLANLRVFVAGCGAAGGACIESLVRMGVTHLRVADNGDYELANLNRQHTFVDQLGKNKAVFHKEEVLRINPFVDIEAFPDGVNPQNLPELASWADIIIDAVDVTVPESIQMKFHLHEVAHGLRKPVLTPIDPGFLQMGLVFDYRNPKTAPIHGRLRRAKEKAKRNPIEGLLYVFPLRTFPNHTLQLLIDLLHNYRQPASQVGCASDVLSGVMAAIIMKFADSRKLPRSWNIELAPYALSRTELLKLWFRGIFMRIQILKILWT